MSFGTQQGPAVLRYVARRVVGSISTEKARFDAKKGQNVFEVCAVENPIIVFFPTGTTQVLAGADAEARGFLNPPDILNLEAVDKPDSIAGKYKFAFNDKQRQEYWKEMEQALISRCIANTGHPLPRDVGIDTASLYFQE